MVSCYTGPIFVHQGVVGKNNWKVFNKTKCVLNALEHVTIQFLRPIHSLI